MENQASAVTITPTILTIGMADTQTFTAVSTPPCTLNCTPTWSIVTAQGDTGTGTINTSGLFTPTSVGTIHIQATIGSLASPPLPVIIVPVFNPSTIQSTSAGGTGVITITKQGTWTLQVPTAATWFQFTNPVQNSSGMISGTGTETVSYQILGNSSTNTLNATLTLAGYNLTITETGAAASAPTVGSVPTLSPATGTFTLPVTYNGIAWSINESSLPSWLHVDSNSTNFANPQTATGTVTFDYDANNSSSARPGTICVAYGTSSCVNVTITQAGGLSFSSNSPQTIPSSGGNYQITVTAPTGTPWTANVPNSADAQWILLSGATGTGSGMFTFEVFPNNFSSPRQGIINIAGLSFTVNQAGAASVIQISPGSATFYQQGNVQFSASQNNTPASVTWTLNATCGESLSSTSSMLTATGTTVTVYAPSTCATFVKDTLTANGSASVNIFISYPGGVGGPQWQSDGGAPPFPYLFSTFTLPTYQNGSNANGYASAQFMITGTTPTSGSAGNPAPIPANSCTMIANLENRTQGFFSLQNDTGSASVSPGLGLYESGGGNSTTSVPFNSQCEVDPAIGATNMQLSGTSNLKVNFGTRFRPAFAAAYPNGYAIWLLVQDQSNGYTVSPIQLGTWSSPSYQPPTVAWSNSTPSGTVSGTVPLIGWAFDNATNPEGPIASIQIQVDGATVQTITTLGAAPLDASCPSLSPLQPSGLPAATLWNCASTSNQSNSNIGWTYPWDSTTVPNGSHTVTVIATDSDPTPHTSQLTRIFTVNNAAALSPIISLPGGSYTGPQNVTLSLPSGQTTGSIYYTLDGTTPTKASTPYSSAVAINQSETLNAIVHAAGFSDSPVASAAYTITASQVAPVVINPGTGTYSSAQSATLSSATTGATVVYTKDGSTPTHSSTQYTGAAISISSTTTINALAFKTGMTDSIVTSATLTIVPPVAAPSFSPAPGTYTTPQSIAITTSTANASIRYTLDGTTPTETAGTLYGGAFAVSATTTIKAIAYATGMADSSVVSVTYTISSGSGPAWYNTSWSYRKAITIAHGQVLGSSNLANFPVLISTIDSNLSSGAQSNGNDILFTDSTGTTKLNHEIESYSSGTLIAWVRIPSLSPTTDTVIYMYYGNSSATNQQSATNVWDANYMLVQHLSNNGALSLNDSTSHGFTFTNNSIAAIAGEISGGADSTGTGATKYATDSTGSLIFNTGDTLTLEAWVKRTDLNPNWSKYQSIFSIGSASSAKNNLFFGFGTGNFGEVDNAIMFGFTVGGGSTDLDFFSHNTADNDTTNFHHYAFTYTYGTGSSAQLYEDGVNVTSASGWKHNAGNDAPDTTANTMYLFASPALNVTLGGIGDEIRVSKGIARSAGWVATEFNNQSSPTSFYSVGSQQTSSGGGSGNGAVFVNTDSVTQGSWKGAYGTNGYNVIDDTVSYPSYVTVTPANQSNYIWTSSTSDLRGLQKVGSTTDRLAATWYASTTFTVDLNFTDGAQHQMAVYNLDWDGGNTRAQTLSILDGATNAVLDSRAVSAFTNGRYVIWKLTGHVILQVTCTGGANAVISGLFFDPPGGGSGSATTTTASNASATYNTGAQNVTLNATVTSSGATVNTGTVTFTVLSGGSQIGTSTSGTVSSGAASAVYILPSGTAPGSFTIHATYNPGTGFATSNDSAHTLTVSSAATTTTAGNASATYSASNQNVTLSATVTSSAGTVNSGTVTFAVLAGGTQIGSPVTSSTASSGSASATFVVPAATAPGTYNIQAIYNPGTGLATSTDAAHTLTVGGASTTTAAANASAVYNASNQHVTLSATVTSSGGTVSSGTVTFTVLNGGTQVGTPVTSGTVSNGSASATYTLPGGTLPALYTIQATYNASTGFSGSVDSSHTLNVISTNGYSYYRAITFNNGKVSGTQTNFPVLISGAYSYLATTGNGGYVTNANGYDIIFTSDALGQNNLPYERENYQSNGTVTFWVQVPTLSSSTTIYVFYGNSSVTTDQSNKPGTWDTNFKGVWHLPNGSTLSANDSTSNANTGSISGAGAVSGEIGGAASFNGSSSSINLGDAGSLQITGQITMSAWVNAAAFPVINTWAYIIGKGYDTSTLNEAYYLRLNAYNNPGTVQLNAGSFYNYSGTNWGNYAVYWNISGWNTNSWHHVVGTYDGTNWNLYFDGALQASNAQTGGALASNTGVYMGAQNSSGTLQRFWNGDIDEVRISNIARSAAWTTTEFNNQSSPSSFYTMGSQQ